MRKQHSLLPYLTTVTILLSIRVMTRANQMRGITFTESLVFISNRNKSEVKWDMIQALRKNIMKNPKTVS